MRYAWLVNDVNDVVAAHRPVSRPDVGYLPGLRRCRIVNTHSRTVGTL
jgi:hypothetical protein